MVDLPAPLTLLHRTLYRVHHKNKSQTRGMVAISQDKSDQPDNAIE